LIPIVEEGGAATPFAAKKSVAAKTTKQHGNTQQASLHGEQL
jgi:hypothetical protein